MRWVVRCKYLLSDHGKYNTVPSGFSWKIYSLVRKTENSLKKHILYRRVYQNPTVDIVFSAQSLSHVQQVVTPWTAARQACLSITSSQSPPKPMSTESVMPSNHLVLFWPLLLLPSIFPGIRVFSSESTLHIRWPKAVKSH